MTTTLRSLRDDTLLKLGDTTLTPAAARVWSEAEIEGYIQDGVRDFCYKSRFVWDMAYLDDLAYTGSYNRTWEKTYFLTGHITHKRFIYTAEWERDYVMTGSAGGLPPANHTNVDERDDFLIHTLIAAVEQLPDQFLVMDRATWDGRKIDPMTSRMLGSFDNYYETVRGQVFGYLQDKDGLRSFRKYKPPSATATYYWAVGKFGVLRASAALVSLVSNPTSMHIDEWAINTSATVTDNKMSLTWDFPPPGAASDLATAKSAITALSEFSSDVVNWRFGILKRLPGYFPGSGPWGLVKKVSQDSSNTRVEFIRRSRIPVSATDIFDIPDYCLKYIKHYALWQAYERKGVGQDPTLSAHYQARYADGVERTKFRMGAIHRQMLYRMGGNGRIDTTAPRPFARLPRNI